MNQLSTPALMSGQVSLSTLDMVVTPATYQGLLEKILTVKKNLRRNLAVLAKFMTWAQRMPHHPVGPELGADFSATRRAFLEWRRKLKPRPKKGTLDNYHSALNAIRAAYADLVQDSIDVNDTRHWRDTVQRALAEAGVGVRAAKERFGSAVNEWLYRGRLPCSRSLETLGRMEQELSRPSGELTRFIVDHFEYDIIADFSGHPNPYRDRLIQLHGKPYFAKFDGQEWAEVRRAWREFARHQTEIDPELERSQPWTKNIRGEYASEIRMEFALRAFFGFLTLAPSEDPELDGLGLPKDALSFPALGCWELLRRFIGFKHQRSGGGERYNGAVRGYLQIFIKLVRPETGWFNQTEARWLPALSRLAEAGMVKDVGPGFFDRQYRACRDWLRKRHKAGQLKFTKTRDPRVTLAPFLNVDNPMDRWIFPLIRRMAENTPPRYGARVRTFYAERRLMLIVAFFAVPLRLINWQLCRVGTGFNLFRGESGEYRLRVTAEEFKNRRFLDDDYAIVIPEWAQPFFAHWVEDVLPGIYPDEAAPRWLLPDIDGKPLTEDLVVEVFSRVFLNYFNYPISPTAARHIVATTYLKENPGHIQEVAVILNDDIQTVLSEYAHLLKQDHFRFYDRYISDVARHHFAPLRLHLPGTGKGRIAAGPAR